MQSDRNNFYGDVVLDSFNKASRDEDYILDQIYKKQIISHFYYKDFTFESDWIKCIYKVYSTLKQGTHKIGF